MNFCAGMIAGGLRVDRRRDRGRCAREQTHKQHWGMSREHPPGRLEGHQSIPSGRRRSALSRRVLPVPASAAAPMAAATMPAAAVPAAERACECESVRGCERLARTIIPTAASTDDNHAAAAIANAAVELGRAQAAVEYNSAAVAIMRLGRSPRALQENRDGSRRQQQPIYQHG
jgi:hypothetical protein